MREILMLVGPTGIGKTHFVCEMAKSYPFEIVSMDSAMVYHELSIGANKPSEEELSLCPHHIINCRSVLDLFDVAQFFDLAEQAITDILSRGKIPILVGGTMMYAHVLKSGLTQSPSLSGESKKIFWHDWQTRTVSEAYAALEQKDPKAAKMLHPSDTQRVLRALEISMILQDSENNIIDQPKRQFIYPLRILGLRPTDNMAHKKVLIDRIRGMLNKGLLSEINELYEKFGDQPLGFWRFVAYRQYWQYFKGDWSLEEARIRTEFATNRLVKHQKTWMNTLVEEQCWVHFGEQAICPDLSEKLVKYGSEFKV